MKYIENSVGMCPLEDAVNMIDIHLQYIDFVPEDAPDYQRAPLQKEGFLKKLNKSERSELESVIARLKICKRIWLHVFQTTTLIKQVSMKKLSFIIY